MREASGLLKAFVQIGAAMRSIQDATAKRIHAARKAGGSIPTSDMAEQMERAHRKRERKNRTRRFQQSHGAFHPHGTLPTHFERFPGTPHLPGIVTHTPVGASRGANRAEARRARVEERRARVEERRAREADAARDRFTLAYARKQARRAAQKAVAVI